MCCCICFAPGFARLLSDLLSGVAQILFHFRGSLARLLIIAPRAGCRGDCQ
jgi:hypothetical protein